MSSHQRRSKASILAEFNYATEWKTLFRFWRSDLWAGITVGVVALPLALGFAITTGAPASAGLTTAIIAGFIAALFGGSNFQVSGPTGAMTVVLVPIVSKYGIDSLIPIGIGAGLLILVMAFLRLGRFIDSVPWSVMEGFTLGIAVIIALQQIPLIFEVGKAEGSHTLGVAIDTLNFALHQEIKVISIALVLSTLLVKWSWPAIREKLGLKAHIPASIIAVVFLTIISEVLDLKVDRIGNLPRNLEFKFEVSFSGLPMSGIVYAIIVVALLGAIESLLSARVADGMARKTIDHEQQKHQPNKELLGQGFATIASAFAGGLPATGAIARTSVNVRSGARTRLAAMIHAAFLLLVVLLLAPLVSIIPTAVLAGVLLGTSLRIASPRSVKEALTTTKAEAVVYLITAVSVVAIDLIWGIVIGLIAHKVAKK
ncbi:MAG: SulP family inorganic anion transporter [Candidatus Nanopelagicaceae bacterium]|nr:SulP family inorganic anion transporter [Candidatus Nanopelagicaceae bacterium]